MKYLPLSIFIIFITFLFGHVKPIFATAPQITASPSGTINIDQSFTLSATMSGLSKNATYRLRVAIAQQGTTDYFGSTYDGTNWHYGSISSGNFVSVITDNSGSWSGSVQGKVDPEDPSFTTGSGAYDLKLGRYTLTGTTATWSDTGAISIYVPPIPTLTPTLTPTAAQSSTQSNTAKPTPTPTKIPTFGITKIPTYLTATPVASISSDVLGTESALVSPQLSKIPKQLVKNTTRVGFPLVVFIIGGILLLVGSVGSTIILLKRRKKQNGEDI